MDSTFLKSIYHETQEAGSMLCGQHALNNLLQAPMFTAQDLADIARQLDALEAAQLGGAGGESQNYDDSGFFSLQVMENALQVLGLRLVRWKSQEMKDSHDHPEQMEAFVLNHDLHWYTIRRFGGVPERFYNLDSCTPAPQWISPTFLGLTLREAELRGYSIFAVIPTADSRIVGLPSCDASDLAQRLPPPSSRGGDAPSTSASTSKTSFQGAGNTLGSAPLASTSTATSSSSSSSTAVAKGKGTNKRPPVDEAMDEDDDSSDDVIIVSGSGSGSGSISQARSTSSVEEESEKRRRRRRIGEKKRELPVSSGSASPAPVPVPVGDGDHGKLSEEEQMAVAIAESLRASKLEETDEDEVAVVQGGSKGKGKGKGKAVEEPAPAAKSRGQVDEEAEFEAALKASLMESGGVEGSGSKEVEEDGGEDDSPSLEEMRRRRLARFG